MGVAMDDQVGAAERAVEEMSYTEASAELEAIVGFFEGREVDVDQLVGRLVRATAIIEELDRRLRRTRVQVEQLVPRLTAVLEEVDVANRGSVEDSASSVTEDDLGRDGGRGRAGPAPGAESGGDPAPGLF